MAVYPVIPKPNIVSAPALIDPLVRFTSDAGYEVRRSRTSRPRRQYTMTYIAKHSGELHTIVDFVQQHRNGAVDFSWIHPTAQDLVTLHDITPVWLSYTTPHGLHTGASLVIFNTEPASALEGNAYVVTRQNALQVSLNGTTAPGGGDRSAAVALYLVHTSFTFPEDVWPEPTPIIGHEQGTLGRWSLTVTVREEF